MRDLSIEIKWLKTLQFNDHSSYIKWRAAWRETYKEASRNGRETKNEFKKNQRRVVTVIQKEIYGESRRACIDGQDYFANREWSTSLGYLRLAQLQAAQLMKMREKSKELSNLLRRVRKTSLAKSLDSWKDKIRGLLRRLITVS